MSEFRLKILTPTTGCPKMAYTCSLVYLVMYYMQNRIYEDVKDQMLGFEPIEGSGIGANRERLVKNALKTDCTHILFIDEDMGFQPECLYIMAGRRLPLVGCNYPMRVKGKGMTALALDKKNRIPLTEESVGTEPCHYTGFGLCLIERWVFEKIEKPWFLIGYNTETETYTTEDAGFARRVSESGIDWHVDHDASKKIYHVGNYNYNWREHGDITGNIQSQVRNNDIKEPSSICDS